MGDSLSHRWREIDIAGILNHGIFIIGKGNFSIIPGEIRGIEIGVYLQKNGGYGIFRTSAGRCGGIGA